MGCHLETFLKRLSLFYRHFWKFMRRVSLFKFYRKIFQKLINFRVFRRRVWTYFRSDCQRTSNWFGWKHGRRAALPVDSRSCFCFLHGRMSNSQRVGLLIRVWLQLYARIIWERLFYAEKEDGLERSKCRYGFGGKTRKEQLISRKSFGKVLPFSPNNKNQELPSKEFAAWKRWKWMPVQIFDPNWAAGRSRTTSVSRRLSFWKINNIFYLTGCSVGNSWCKVLILVETRRSNEHN